MARGGEADEGGPEADAAAEPHGHEEPSQPLHALRVLSGDRMPPYPLCVCPLPQTGGQRHRAPEVERERAPEVVVAAEGKLEILNTNC